MGLFDRIKRAFAELVEQPEELTLADYELAQWLGINTAGSRKALSEATYFTCLKILSETMGKLPLKYYQQSDQGRIRATPTKTSRMLALRPNEYMSSATFWTMMEYNCQHYGNAYAWIRTRRGTKGGRYGREREVIDLWPMRSDRVEILIDDIGWFREPGKVYYRYTDDRSGKSYVMPSESVLHIKTWCTKDGIVGKSVREILKDTIGGGADAQKYQNSLIGSGLSASAVLQYTGEIDRQKRIKLQNEYNSLLSGAKNAGKVVAIPIGMELKPIKMTLQEAQFIELRKYTALQIAAAFGIKPNHLNNYEKSSYANSEMQQLSFLVDTMLYRLAIYEQEINSKILTLSEEKEGFFYKFNEKALLRADAKTQMETIAEGVQNALYTPNEGREYLDLPAKEGGDILICNGNYMPVEMAGAQYAGKEESNGGDQH